MVESELAGQWKHSAEKPFIHSLIIHVSSEILSLTLKDMGLNSGNVQLKRFHRELGWGAMRGGS